MKSILKKVDTGLEKALRKNYFGYKPKLRNKEPKKPVFKCVRFANSVDNISNINLHNS